MKNSTSSHRSNWWLVSAAIAVLGWRSLPFLQNPQFFCEDGTVFFVDAYNDGWRSLFYSYEGYSVLYQRLIAWFGTFLPIENLPAFYVVSALFAPLALFSWIVCSGQPVAQTILALAVVALSPFDATVYATLTNSQWMLAGLLLFEAGANTARRPSVLEQVVFVVAALTGPFVLFFLPIFLLRGRGGATERMKRWRQLSVVCAAFQLAFSTALLAPRVLGSIDLLDWNWLWAIEMLFSYPIYTLSGALQNVFFALFTIGSILGTAGLIIRKAQNTDRGAVVAYLAGAAVVVAVSLFAYRTDPNTLLFRPRYAFLPTLGFGWAAVVHFGRGGYRAGLAVVAITVAAGIGQFMSKPLTDLNWQTRSACIRESKLCVIPLNWEGRFIEYDPEQSAGMAGRRGRLKNISGSYQPRSE